VVKKLFALASISGLTGLMVTMAASGCSSTTTTAGADTTDASTATDAAKTLPKEAAADDAATTPGVCPSTDIITSADIAMQLKWMPPLPPQNVCVQKNIDDLRDLIIKNGTMGTKFTDIQTALGATCAACAFSKDTAANWQPYVQTTNGFLSNRTASCLAQVESAACGKAAFELDICGKIACNTTDCPTDAEVTACQKKAFAKGGACNAIGQTFVTACPNEAVQLDPATGPCATSPQAIAVSCAGGPDGGLDASLP
jgi:hypothetical protein